MTTFDVGRKAEAAAAEYLRGHGFEIIDQNWRTRQCEIDIVARKDDAMYFAEVKYRKSASQGSGLEYITPKKLQQMQFAADVWIHENKWSGDSQLAALEVEGPNFSVSRVVYELYL